MEKNFKVTITGYVSAETKEGAEESVIEMWHNQAVEDMLEIEVTEIGKEEND